MTTATDAQVKRALTTIVRTALANFDMSAVFADAQIEVTEPRANCLLLAVRRPGQGGPRFYEIHIKVSL